MLTLRWRYATGYVRGFVSGLREHRRAPVADAPASEEEDDPDMLLAQAQTEMRENQAKNRERAVQAITAKNNLQNEVDKTQKIVANLQAKADKAAHEGNPRLTEQLLTERDAYQETLTKMQASLVSCTASVERVKAGVRREEERIRAKTAHAMALKAQWKQHQITMNIAQASEGDAQMVLRLLQAEVGALREIIRRTDAELHGQVEKALRDGDRDLARAILMERVALRSALSEQ